MISPLFLRRPQLELIFNDFSPLNSENSLKRQPNSKVESQDWIFYFPFCFVQMPQMKQPTGLLLPTVVYHGAGGIAAGGPAGTGGAAGWGPHPLSLGRAGNKAHRKCHEAVKAEAELPVTNFLWSSSTFQTSSVTGDQMSRHTSYTTLASEVRLGRSVCSWIIWSWCMSTSLQVPWPKRHRQI